MIEPEAPPLLFPSPSLLEGRSDLDPAVDALRSVAGPLVADESVKGMLQGTWLGHSVHPLMTDLAIGFWTSAFVLDLFPVKRVRAASDLLVGLGLVSAVPTVLTGLADWSDLGRGKQRVGVVHAAANAAGTGCYAISLANRVRGRRARGIAFSTLGAVAMSVGGHLGGHLAFGESTAGDEAADEGPAAAP